MQPASSDLADLLRRWNDVDTTALVHEAYLELAGLRQAGFRDRAHVLAMASRVMRRLLVEVKRDLQYARAWRAERVAEGARAS